MIELLESRIAPATLLPGGKGVTFTDPDGDAVTIKTTKGEFAIGNNIGFVAEGAGERCYFISVGSTFTGANLTMTVKKVPGGDGKADVSALTAQNVNLGSVTILGDLEQIVCGSGDAKIPAIKSLKVGSFGVHQEFPGTQQSTIKGAAGSITIGGDFQTEYLLIDTDNVSPRSGAFKIGGSVLGTTVATSGGIHVGGLLSSFTVGHDVKSGRTGFADPQLFFGDFGFPSVGRFSVGGNIDATTVFLRGAGSATIGGSLLNGAHFSEESGGTLTVKGDIKSGAGVSFLDARSISIKGSLDMTTMPPMGWAGLEVRGKAGSISVLGSVFGNAEAGILAYDAKAIHIFGDFSSSIYLAPANPGGAKNFKASVTIDGSVSSADFIINPSSVPVCSFAIKVGGDWTSSSVKAGVVATADPTSFTNGIHPAIIESLTIKGEAKVNGANKLSIIAADAVKAVSIKGKKAPLTPNADEKLSIFDAGANEVMVITEAS